MSKPVYLEPRSAAVLAHMLAGEGSVTAAEIGRDSGFYPHATPAELGGARPLPGAPIAPAWPSRRAPTGPVRHHSAVASRSRCSAPSSPEN